MDITHRGASGAFFCGSHRLTPVTAGRTALESRWTERAGLVRAVMYRRGRVTLRSPAPQEVRGLIDCVSAAAPHNASPAARTHMGHQHAAAEASRYVIHAAREHEESFNKWRDAAIGKRTATGWYTGRLIVFSESESSYSKIIRLGFSTATSQQQL